jgi:hypothetical protein
MKTLRVVAAVRASGLPFFNYAEGANHGKGGWMVGGLIWLSI